MTAHIVLPRLRTSRLKPMSQRVRVGFAPTDRGADPFWKGVGLPIALALSALIWALIVALIV